MFSRVRGLSALAFVAESVHENFTGATESETDQECFDSDSCLFLVLHMPFSRPGLNFLINFFFVG